LADSIESRWNERLDFLRKQATEVVPHFIGGPANDGQRKFRIALPYLGSKAAASDLFRGLVGFWLVGAGRFLGYSHRAYKHPNARKKASKTQLTVRFEPVSFHFSLHFSGTLKVCFAEARAICPPDGQVPGGARCLAAKIGDSEKN
jgi:hypothetical protein